MSSRLLGLLFLAVIAFGSWVSGAWGQDHHPLHRDFYRHWKQPGSELSCCNARIVWPQGAETGDCEPTDAKLISGRWYARLPHDGPYIEVPEDKIIREHNPTHDGSNGHLCFTPSQGVLCFVPPFGGG